MRTIILSAIMLFLTEVVAQNTMIDSLKTVINEGKLHDTLIADACTKLSHLLMKNRQTDDALKYIEKAYQISDNNNYQKGLINSLNAKAAYYTDKGRYKDAIVSYQYCIDYCKNVNHIYGEMNSYNSIGLTYYNMGNYKESLKNHLRALKLAEKEGNYLSAAKYHANISRIYSVYNDYDKAIYHINKAIDIEKKHNGQAENIVIRIINLSNYLTEKKDYKKAIIAIYEGISINDSIVKNKVLDAYIRNNLAQAYFKSGNTKAAIPEYLKAEKIFLSINDSVNVATIFTNMANIYASTSQTALSINYIKKSFIYLPDDYAEAESKRYRHEVATMIYEKAGDYKNALGHVYKLMAIKDSIYKKEQADAVIQMQIQYETKLKEDSLIFKNLELKQQQTINKQTLSNSKQKSLLLLISTICMITLIFFTVITVINYKKQQKANKILIEQKQLIEQKNRENETLLSEIHHRVKNNLQVISSLLSLQGKSIEDNSARIAIEAGKQRVKSMELVHKMLYEGTNFSFIEMNEYIYKLAQNLSDVYGMNHHNFKLDIISKTIKLDIDTAIPIALILNELMVNSLKYARIDNITLIILVSINEHNNKLIVKYSDNGKGTYEENILNSESFGIKLVKLLVKQLAGKIELNNNNGLHYTFIIKEYKKVNTV